MKKISALLMFVLLAMPLAAVPALANHHGQEGGCPWKKGCSHGKCGKEGGDCPIVEKIMMKAHFFLENQAEIGLSEDQVSKIKAIKMDVEKSIIRNKAEQQIFMLDLKAKLSEPALDVEGINARIDQGMAGMATGAKSMVAALADLKGVLTEEQMAKAKEIWKKM